ncbi:hypothetical protein [Sutcliffiella sp. NC1]|uniref:hypothetical protein n=1 Tax=Sutcliffiella sp. NC1 TaxID=3004096 RepID=UPI0022DD4A29|nr:hypothetical protein [Sutcliffiella sp. NC1]WBL16355.1 hypothetical protein O1A01_06910 [Sutcliffiella sp. NC1]
MNREEIKYEILSFLERNPKTHLDAIKGHVEEILRQKGIIGRISEHQGGAIYTRTVRIDNDIALYINEVIYDLLYQERILTPGVSRDNLDLPFLHVSKMEKLLGKLEKD